MGRKVILFLLALMSLIPTNVSADEQDRSAFAALRPMVVKVRCWNPLTRQETSHGTGFWYCPGPGCVAVVVTARHCTDALSARNALQIVEDSGQVLEIRQIIRAKDSDVAILYLGDIKDKITCAFRNTPAPVGESLWAAGYPMAECLTFTRGITTSYNPDLMVTNTNLYFGNSGCPLIDENHQIAGLFVSMRPSDSHFRYCIPGSEVGKSVQLLMQRIDRSR